MKLSRFRDAVGPEGIYIVEDTFDVVRETPCFYIIMYRGKERRVGKQSHRPFADINRDRALLAFKARKSYQMRYVQELVDRILRIQQHKDLTLADFTEQYGSNVHIINATDHAERYFVFD